MAKDPRVRCATCGLTYDPGKKPLPKCGSEDGPAGPNGFRPEERKFMKCVLSVESNAIKVPDVPGPKGVCWVRDTRIPGNLVGAHCMLKKRHKGKHQWER